MRKFLYTPVFHDIFALLHLFDSEHLVSTPNEHLQLFGIFAVFVNIDLLFYILFFRCCSPLGFNCHCGFCRRYGYDRSGVSTRQAVGLCCHSYNILYVNSIFLVVQFKLLVIVLSWLCFAGCSLLVVHYWLFTVGYTLFVGCSLLVVHCLLLTVSCSLLVVHCWLFTVGCTLLAVDFYLFTVSCSLLVVHCWLYIVCCTLLDVHCWLHIIGCSLLVVHCWL